MSIEIFDLLAASCLFRALQPSAPLVRSKSKVYGFIQLAVCTGAPRLVLMPAIQDNLGSTLCCDIQYLRGSQYP